MLTSMSHIMCPGRGNGSCLMRLISSTWSTPKVVHQEDSCIFSLATLEDVPDAQTFTGKYHLLKD